jgi:DNA-directed RNA polymerase subunit M/transcription elongation factor TFIIS
MLDCKKCLQVLPEEKFSKKSGSARGYHYTCKDCHNTYSRETWYVKNSEKQKASSLKWKQGNKTAVRATRYGISKKEMTKLLESGKCAICGGDTALGVDHSHETGEVRGLLCRTCNSGLGFFRDSPELLQKAIQYLDQPL